MLIDYFPKTNHLDLILLHVPLDAKQLPSAAVYSLVDFIPGVISTEAGVFGNVCEDRYKDPATCDALLHATFQQAKVTYSQFLFPYPKSITFDEPNAGTCQFGDNKPLVQRLTKDIDQNYELAHDKSPESSADADELCKDIVAARKADLT